MASVIRSYSKSEFDHVAMVMRDPDQPNEVYLLEAVGSNGIVVKQYSKIRDEIGVFYKTMALRHLEFPRSDQALQTLDKFVDEVYGSNYEISLSDLLTKK